VPFFWPARHILAPLLVVAGALLAAFYLIDRRFAVGELPAPRPERFRVRGLRNVALILLVVLVVLGQGFVPVWDVVILGQTVVLAKPGVVVVLLLITVASIAITPRAIRQSNDFTWHPMAEVATLFAAIFITIGPVVMMLRAGIDGPMAPLMQLSQGGDGQPRPLVYFWLTGLLSAFLDNAPTYLVFFELAGIRPAALSGADGAALAAVSAGAVFFGGLTYIGNAPNMMLRAIAAHRGVRMPGFFGFTLLASALLIPVLTVVGLLFFR
jgi:Na+/H+ antiporter NhaD/arsenite permease-like protein